MKEMPGRETATDGHSTDVPSIVYESLRSPGQPLDEGTRADMEPRYGHDFSKVRMHTDAKAWVGSIQRAQDLDLCASIQEQEPGTGISGSKGTGTNVAGTAGPGTT